ncbi:MAG TPA: TM2 domain-containing protein [Silvibacterium sp.]|nr:TM2 domain-containing protein [Silvibacterium sp.]
MIATLPLSASAWTDEQRAYYYAHMSAWQKDEVVGVLLALFLGTFGAHQFYLRRPGLGILYCVFSWTGIPTVVSFIECFFMPGRVRQYNLALATYFAGQLGSPTVIINTPAISGLVRTCASCGASLLTGSNYCGHCGAKVS